MKNFQVRDGIILVLLGLLIWSLVRSFSLETQFSNDYDHVLEQLDDTKEEFYEKIQTLKLENDVRLDSLKNSRQRVVRYNKKKQTVNTKYHEKQSQNSVITDAYKLQQDIRTRINSKD